MQKSLLAPLILGAAVLALLALQVSTSMRITKLQEQIAKLEERPGGGGATVASADGGRSSAGGSDPAREGSAHADGGGRGSDAPAVPAAGPGDPGPGGSRKPVLRTADGPITEKDIEALIEKKLAEHDKKNPLAQIMNFEDPLVVMERELKLSPIQKTRIQQHFKERDDAMMELWQTEEARKDWRGTEEKAGELRKKCEESVKRELDLAQQEKYEELKKAGKISDFGGGGMSIMIGGSKDSTDPADGK